MPDLLKRKQSLENGSVKFPKSILGDAALLEAAKKGNLARVQKLATPENINCRDTQGRNSTPLHLAGKCCFPLKRFLAKICEMSHPGYTLKIP